MPTLADLTASNSARLKALAEPSWFIDDPEYQQAVANFMHEAMTIIRKEREHEQNNQRQSHRGSSATDAG